MIGVTVAVVISTMPAQSCIDLHKARNFEKCSIHTSRIHNDEIAEAS